MRHLKCIKTLQFFKLLLVPYFHNKKRVRNYTNARDNINNTLKGTKYLYMTGIRTGIFYFGKSIIRDNGYFGQF